MSRHASRKLGPHGRSPFVEEEEKDLFKSVKKLLTKEELAVMGEQLETMFSEIIQTQLRMQVPRETDEAAPLT